MSTLKKILFIFSIVTSTCIFSLIALTFIVFHYPESSYNFLAEYLLPKDLKITWQDMQFDSKNMSSFHYAIDWTIHDLRIKKQRPFLDLPMDQIHLRAQLSLFSEPHIQLQGLKLLAEHKMIFIPDRTKAQPEQNPFESLRTYLDILEKINANKSIQNLDLQVTDFHLASTINSGLHFSLLAKQEDLSSPLFFDLKMRKEIKPIFSVDGNLSWQALNSEEPFIVGKINYQQDGLSLVQSFSLSAQKQQAQLKSEGSIHFIQDHMHLILDPKISLQLQPKMAHLKIKSNLRGIPGPLVHIDNLNLSLDSPLEANRLWGQKNSNFLLSAPIDIFFVDRSSRNLLEKNCHCSIPETLAAKLEGQLNFANLWTESSETSFISKMQLKVDSITNSLFSLQLAAALEINKKAGEWIYSPSLDSSLNVHNFQGVKNILAANHILVPAPLDILKGSLYFESKGSSHKDQASTYFPLFLNLDLHSTKQKVKLQADGNIQLANNLKQADVNLNINLQDVQILLPPLDPLKGLPRITADPRILKKPMYPEKSNPPDFLFNFAYTLKTENPGSVKLYYKYFEPYLPLSIQLENNGKNKITGYLLTEPFTISYLRRKVQVKKMYIDLNSIEKDSIPVDAKFVVKQTDYTIFIDVTGDLQNPNIILSSEPYLSSSEIISVLLYDRTSDQLIAVDAETAGGVQAAMADRAIGLFGLWAFASTPIRSFSYNPVTKVYSASVAVTDDISANIGTNWEQASHLELRKRVSRKWVLTAAWTPATQDTKQQSKLVLQWEKRF